MTAEQWWAALLNGSVGAALSIAGVLFVFWLTRRSEKRTSDDERVREAVVNIAKKSLPIRYAEPGSDKEEEVIEAVGQELLLFFLRELGTHEEPARWAHRQKENLETLLGPDADIRLVRIYASHVVASLSSWAAFSLPKNYFKDDMQRIGINWDPNVEGFDFSLKVTRREAANVTPEIRARIEEALG